MPDGVTGAEQFTVLARHLRAAGESGLRAELFKEISHSTRPILGEIRRELPARFPNRYAATFASDLSLRTSKTTRTGVQIRATTRGRNRRLRRLDRGSLWHPLFGDKHHWYHQNVGPRWFSGPTEDSAPQVRDAIVRAMNDTARKIMERT